MVKFSPSQEKNVLTPMREKNIQIDNDSELKFISPFACFVVGWSGSGKSVTVLSWLRNVKKVFRSDFTAKWIWEDLGNNASQKWVGMTFKVKNIEVLRRRSKYAFPCNNDWTHDDDKIMENIVQTIQCTPSHWDLNNHENACSQVRNIFKMLDNLTLLI